VQVLEGDDFRKTYTVALPNKPALLAVECVDSGIAIKCASKHEIFSNSKLKIIVLRNRRKSPILSGQTGGIILSTDSGVVTDNSWKCERRLKEGWNQVRQSTMFRNQAFPTLLEC
jgi:hypothetical protein